MSWVNPGNVELNACTGRPGRVLNSINEHSGWGRWKEHTTLAHLKFSTLMSLTIRLTTSPIALLMLLVCLRTSAYLPSTSRTGSSAQSGGVGSALIIHSIVQMFYGEEKNLTCKGCPNYGPTDRRPTFRWRWACTQQRISQSNTKTVLSLPFLKQLTWKWTIGEATQVS